MGSRLGLGLGFGLENLNGMVVTQNIQFKMSVCGKKDSWLGLGSGSGQGQVRVRVRARVKVRVRLGTVVGGKRTKHSTVGAKYTSKKKHRVPTALSRQTFVQAAPRPRACT